MWLTNKSLYNYELNKFESIAAILFYTLLRIHKPTIFSFTKHWNYTTPKFEILTTLRWRLQCPHVWLMGVDLAKYWSAKWNFLFEKQLSMFSCKQMPKSTLCFEWAIIFRIWWIRIEKKTCFSTIYSNWMLRNSNKYLHKGVIKWMYFDR